MNKKNTIKLVSIAMFCAVSYIMMAVMRVPIVMFLKYDPKDSVILLCGFIFGPLSAIAVSVIVSIFEMFTVSETGLIGIVMNIISTCAFVCPAAIIYRKNRKISGAVIGIITGIISVTGIMLLWNYLLTPIYQGVDRAVIKGMLVPIFLPFNLLKATLNGVIAMALYKPMIQGLRAAGVLPPSEISTKNRYAAIVTVSCAIIAVLCIVFFVLFAKN